MQLGGRLPCRQYQAAHTEKVHLIVLGTHGYGLVGRFFMGSIAQRVVASRDVPVLLVK